MNNVFMLQRTNPLIKNEKNIVLATLTAVGTNIDLTKESNDFMINNLILKRRFKDISTRFFLYLHI